MAHSTFLPSDSRTSLQHSAPEAGSISSTWTTSSQSQHSSASPEHPGERNATEGKRRSFKRIVVLCDGTWEDGIRDQQRSSYTNVLRLARSLHHEDARREREPPIPQVVFYQSGIGSGNNFYSEYIEADKVEDAYAFIAHNFIPGDEIFLFGFSRGAYTARMIAMFIGAIGVLTRKDMDHFGSIFLSFQNLGICKKEDIKKRTSLETFLAPWRSPDSEGHQRAAFGKNGFTVKCVGVWDTVGSLGLPHEIDPAHKDRHQLFSFPDCNLGEHIQTAYQALAINEMRKDFVCTKFIQSDAGKAKGQILKQTWFSGCHADIGGGYPVHDLSDLSLIWMAVSIPANVEKYLRIDVDYLQGLLNPVAPWGVQIPHDSRTGVFALTLKLQRTLPTAPNPQTNETVHASVVRQIHDKTTGALEGLAKAISAYPMLVAESMPLEDLVRETWPYNPRSPGAQAYESSPKRFLLEEVAPPPVQVAQTESIKVIRTDSWFSSLIRSVSSGSSGSRSRSSISTSSISTSNSTQPTDTEGLDSSSSMEVVKKSGIAVISATSIGASRRKRERVVNAVANSATVVVHSGNNVGLSANGQGMIKVPNV
ncbi:hypothetical protein HYPSUDRAFT_127796 [Hypholoma sublateritium FD-334 SS-4]|uniref:T6SS Phospholipase effector Tle1-like catalytic domain-containing protein n=1 Tax=Hypholoma sublateritium (strain FD-334 SS-4) TaxID=945553 RepID=A0A0D2LMY0_HYPSF|nr:hypothetical protein HYPSUDRAFT_127796 [Hypholoma sublateritium FD-334 SS-4]